MAKTPNLADRNGEFYLDLKDRRRLVVSELFFIAEQHDGLVTQLDFGKAVLHNIVVDSNSDEATEHDTMQLSDSASTRISQLMQGGR